MELFPSDPFHVLNCQGFIFRRGWREKSSVTNFWDNAAGRRPAGLSNVLVHFIFLTNLWNLRCMRKFIPFRRITNKSHKGFNRSTVKEDDFIMCTRQPLFWQLPFQIEKAGIFHAEHRNTNIFALILKVWISVGKKWNSIPVSLLPAHTLSAWNTQWF